MFVIIVMISFYICLRNINKNQSFTIQKHVHHKKKKIVHQKIPSRYVYLNDKKLSLVNFQDMKVATLKKKNRVIFLDNFYKFKKLIYTIIKETSKSSSIGI